MRIAAIDIGTNSIHMVIASARDASGFEIVDREREVVQIGRGSFATGVLADESIRNAVSALQRFVELARRHRVDDILCTATAAVREAGNGGEFLAAAREASGIEPRVIPAAEEGRLIYLGLKSALNLASESFLVVDIGGGSMQLVAGNADRLFKVVSAPLGALRLTETMLDSDPPKPREIASLERHVAQGVRAALAPLARYAPKTIYGSSGSIHALASAAHHVEKDEGLDQINGHVFMLKSLRRISRELKGMTLAERERLEGLDAKRAEIIVPGALVLERVLEEVKASAIVLTDYGVREGLVTDYLQKHARELTILTSIDDLRLRSGLQLLARFGESVEHPRHVALLALALFDGFAPVHGIGGEGREILQFAALLHDIGAVIGFEGHAEHSYYIIKNAKLRGFTPEDLELIARVARYHGKGKPGKKDPSFAGLRKKDRKLVRWLSAILRVAERLDRSHYQLVRGLNVRIGEKSALIDVDAGREAQLEIWAARQRLDALAKLAGVPVAIVWNRAGAPEGGSEENGGAPRGARSRRGSASAQKRRATRR